MPAINFQKQFAPAVKSGAKRQTIRAIGKRVYQPGQQLHLYVGQRTRGCKLLRRETCKAVTPVYIDTHTLVVGTHTLTGPERQAFARADGFDHWQAMFDWFQDEHGLPFEGRLISW